MHSMHDLNLNLFFFVGHWGDYADARVLPVPYGLIPTIHVSHCIYIFDVNEWLQLMLRSQPGTK